MSEWPGTPVEQWPGKPVIQPQPATPEATGEDIGRSLAGGLGRGAIGIGGAPADLGGALQKGIDWAARGITGKNQQQLEAGRPGYVIDPKTLEHYGTEAMVQDATTGKGTNIPALPGLAYEPQTTAGKYAHTAGEFAPGAAFGTGNLARRLATQVIAPAIGSEAAGQAAQGTKYEVPARIAGAVAGGLAPSAASRVITPFQGASAQHRAAVGVLRGEGIEPTAGQATNSRGLKYYESEMGGGATTRAMERQGEQFTGAALRRVGEDAPRATPEVVDHAFTRIGQQFDDLAARNTATIDHPFVNDIVRTVSDYDQLVPRSNQAPVVANTVSDIMQHVRANGPDIPGATYQSWRSRLDRAARASRTDPQLQDALYGVRNALDDAMERSISPADQAAWREARNQYRNMMVLEKAATGAGQNAAEGIISPSALRNATVVGHGRRNYARGQGDFAELARAGEAVLKPLPDSGTSSRLTARGLPNMISGGIGAGIGALGGGPIGGGFGMAAGAAAGSAINRGMGRAAMSRPIQSYLANELLNGSQLGGDATRAGLAELLLRGPSEKKHR